MTFRLSQWKMGDFDGRICETAEEWGEFLKPISEAGVDMFHLSQRRFWHPEFAGSDMSVAAWTKKLTGKPVMSVGSVGVTGEFYLNVFQGAASEAAGIDGLIDAFERGDFDLIAVGRAILNDHQWVSKVREDRFDEMKPLPQGGLLNYY
jgi:2,4-dienoyl-CoA reductase-like NADH-dependent reductase (Old Yellow Enzyme family)